MTFRPGKGYSIQQINFWYSIQKVKIKSNKLMPVNNYIVIQRRRRFVQAKGKSNNNYITVIQLLAG